MFRHSLRGLGSRRAATPGSAALRPGAMFGHRYAAEARMAKRIFAVPGAAKRSFALPEQWRKVLTDRRSVPQSWVPQSSVPQSQAGSLCHTRLVFRIPSAAAQIANLPAEESRAAAGAGWR